MWTAKIIDLERRGENPPEKNAFISLALGYKPKRRIKVPEKGLGKITVQ